jgi:hypothetical protein
MTYTHITIPQAERPQRLLRKPNPLRDGWAKHPTRKRVYRKEVTDAELISDGWIIVGNKPDTATLPGYNEATKNIAWTGIDDAGDWTYEITDKSQAQLDAYKDSIKQTLWQGAIDHQATFTDPNGGWQLANWKSDFYVGAGPFTDPAFRSSLGPYIMLMEVWIKSVWDHYQTEKGKVDNGLAYNPDYAHLGTLPFSFSQVREAIYSGSIDGLPENPQIVYTEPE